MMVHQLINLTIYEMDVPLELMISLVANTPRVDDFSLYTNIILYRSTCKTIKMS